MSRRPALPPLLRTWIWLCALLAASLIGCGGGGGGQTAGVGVGGTGGSGGTGPITGLGSIIVNDVRFDDSSVIAQDEDNSTASTALGVQVEVVGGPTHIDSLGFTAATATTVRVIRAVQGPVQGSVQTTDNVSGTVVVLGQTVLTDGATLYQGLPQGLLSLVDGTLVTVYAFYDAHLQRFLATRIEASSALSAYVVRAQVASVDSAQGSFIVGSLVIDGSSLASLPSVGQLVRVRLGTAANGQGRWPALSSPSAAPQSWADGTALKVEGLVSDFGSLSNFKVNGQAVNASGQVTVNGNNGNIGGVINGSQVEVEGVVSGGVLVASKLSFKTSGGSSGAQAKLIGPISGADTGNDRFTLKGLTVTYDPTPSTGTRFDDGVEADLVNGRQVEAEGTLSTDGSTLTATRIRLR